MRRLRISFNIRLIGELVSPMATGLKLAFRVARLADQMLQMDTMAIPARQIQSSFNEKNAGPDKTGPGIFIW